MSEKKIEKKQETARQLDSQHQATLNDYYDKMSELILEQNLSDGERNSNSAKMARARTLAVLRSLDPERVETVS